MRQGSKVASPVAIRKIRNAEVEVLNVRVAALGIARAAAGRLQDATAPHLRAKDLPAPGSDEQRPKGRT